MFHILKKLIKDTIPSIGGLTDLGLNNLISMKTFVLVQCKIITSQAADTNEGWNH